MRAVLTLLSLVFLFATRSLLEERMWLHMLIQIPACVVLGVLLSSRTREMANALGPWNRHGAAGLLLSFAVVSVWMVPRMLDAAVESVLLDGFKFTSLAIAGLAAGVSWRVAPTSVCVFAIGNGVWMTATVGMLLLDAPNRLCVSYGARDQEFAGYGLLIVALLGGAAAATDLLRGYLGAGAATRIARAEPSQSTASPRERSRAMSAS